MLSIQSRDHDDSGAPKSADFQTVGALQLFMESGSVCSGEQLESQMDLSLSPASSTCLLRDPGTVISSLRLSVPFYRGSNLRSTIGGCESSVMCYW